MREREKKKREREIEREKKRVKGCGVEWERDLDIDVNKIGTHQSRPNFISATRQEGEELVTRVAPQLSHLCTAGGDNGQVIQEGRDVGRR